MKLCPMCDNKCADDAKRCSFCDHLFFKKWHVVITVFVIACLFILLQLFPPICEFTVSIESRPNPPTTIPSASSN
jgi:hypothetical protein